MIFGREELLACLARWNHEREELLAQLRSRRCASVAVKRTGVFALNGRIRAVGLELVLMDHRRPVYRS